MSILEANNVSIRYMTGDFKEIGLKEYVMRRIKHDYHVVEFWADRNISFTLEKGDMLGIIGTNGAGKSTLLKAISGIMEPTSGWIKREGTIAALLELGSGFDGELTVRENTYLRGAMLGYTRKFMDETYDQIIDFAELREFENRPFKQLSSGMKSRLAFSIASLVKPDILILDEVLSVGDGAFRQKSEAKMREIIGGGATTILVSHSIEQVRALCNKVLWIDKGEMIAYGTDVDMICTQYEEFLSDKTKQIELRNRLKSTEELRDLEKASEKGETRPISCMGGFLANTSRRIFYLMLFFLPFIFFLSNSVLSSNIFTIQTAIFAIGIIGILILCAKFKDKLLKKSIWWIILIIICCCGLLLRLYYIFDFPSIPASDMACTHNFAAGTAQEDIKRYVLSVPYLWNEGLILSAIYSIFGVSLLAAKIFNAIVACLTIFFLGIAGRSMMKRTVGALLPAVFFAINPALAIYTLVLTIEHLSMLMLAIFLSIIGNLHNAICCSEKKKMVILAIGGGVSLGLYDICKPVATVILIALVIVEIYYFKKHFSGKIKRIALILLMWVSFTCTVNLYQGIYTSCTGYRSDVDYVDMIYHGMIAEGGGVYNSAIKKEIADLHAEYGEEADKILLSRLSADIKAQPRAYIDLIIKKMKICWDTGDQYISWAAPQAKTIENRIDLGDDFDEERWDLEAREFRNKNAEISKIYYFVFASICLLGTLNLVVKPQKSRFLSFFSAITIFGFGAMMILIEVQGRYKSVIEPMICLYGGYSAILAGNMFYKIKEVLWRFRGRYMNDDVSKGIDE